MPNKYTFQIKPFHETINRYLGPGFWIDPFLGRSPFKDKMTATNDLNPEMGAQFQMDSLSFLQVFEDNQIDGVLFDPPYSPRQVTECYKGIGLKATTKDTQARFWGDLKKEIGRIVKPGGKVISLGWNSGGMGKSNGFKQVEIVLCAHGGWHNDTILTVEEKS